MTTMYVWHRSPQVWFSEPRLHTYLHIFKSQILQATHGAVCYIICTYYSIIVERMLNEKQMCSMKGNFIQAVINNSNTLVCCLFSKLTYALSFYWSQNVLGWSKFFVSDQKFIYILWQSQTFCARQKDDLHSVKLVFVPAKKFLKRH
jgi:hypothetical protein